METLTRIFGLDAQLIQDTILTALAIFILFFVLSYLFYDTVRDVLEKRKKKISDQLKEANDSLQKAESMKAEYESKLSEAEAKTAEILDEARKNAHRKESEIIEGAKEEAHRISLNAQKEIELEKAKAVDEVKKEIIEVASEIAEKAVNAQMTPQISDALVDETLKNIGAETWQEN